MAGCEVAHCKHIQILHDRVCQCQSENNLDLEGCDISIHSDIFQCIQKAEVTISSLSCSSDWYTINRVFFARVVFANLVLL